MLTPLPSSDRERGVPRSTGHWPPPRSRRSQANLVRGNAAEVWSLGSKLRLVRVELPHAHWQWTASRGSAGALRVTAQHPRDGANGPFGQLEEVWLWKFVGRAGVPCLSTVRVSTRARVIYKFCSVCKRAAVMDTPLTTTPSLCAPAAAGLFPLRFRFLLGGQPVRA